MAEVQWYYARNNQQYGPVSAGELKQLAEAGRLAPDDLLWREGMEAWTTAVNLRGLFAADLGSAKNTPPAGVVDRAPPVQTPGLRAPSGAAPARRATVRSLLHATQTLLWTMCVLVVLAGVVLFTRAFLNAKDATAEAAAGAVYSTFFIAAYVLARAGEKLSRLLLASARRRSR